MGKLGVGSMGAGEGGELVCSPLLTGEQKSYDKGVSVDWLSITFPEFGEVVERTSEALGIDSGEWVETPHGVYGYAKGLIGPGGARIWSEPPGDRSDCHVVLPGQACGAIGGARLASYLKDAVTGMARATRLDMAIDDYLRIASVEEVVSRLGTEEAISHAERYNRRHECKLGTGDIIGGDTVYVGTPRSRQQLRVYDKLREGQVKQVPSEELIDAVRWEMETRDEPAQTFLSQLAAVGVEGWGRVASSRLARFLDFRVPGMGSNNTHKRQRSAWYGELLGHVNKLTAYPPKQIRSVEEIWEWLKKATPRMLALVVKYHGDLMPLVKLVEIGNNKLKPSDKGLIGDGGSLSGV